MLHRWTWLDREARVLDRRRLLVSAPCQAAAGQEDAEKEGDPNPTYLVKRASHSIDELALLRVDKGGRLPEHRRLASLRPHASIHRSLNGVGLRATRVSGEFDLI
jgi:hypothetical protein